MTDQTKQRLVLQPALDDHFRVIFEDNIVSTIMPSFDSSVTNHEYIVMEEDRQFLSLAVQSCPLPGVSNPERKGDTPLGGKATDWEPNIEFGGLSMTFRLDESYWIHSFFLYWMLLKVHPELMGGIAAYGSVPKNALFVDTTLVRLTNQNSIASTYTFKRVHPTDITDVQQDMTSSGNRQTLDVTFGYDYYIPGSPYNIDIKEVQDG